MTADTADTDSDGELEESELAGLTKAQLRQVAADAGYEVTKTTKADIITEILTAQAVDTTGTLTETQLGYFTVARILAIATARSYTMTSTATTAKATVITEFLAAQTAASSSQGGGG